MKLSVITINLNNAEGLRKTVESVVNQTFNGFEFIVIDGGSNDDSKEVIRSYSDKISYWASEPDSGIYNAMNKGLAKATGEFVNFLNSGDYFYNTQVLEKIFENEIVGDIIYTNGCIPGKSGRLKRFDIPEKLTLLYLIEARLCHNSSFISCRTLKNIGFFNERYRIISDAEFFIKAFLAGSIFQKINVCSVVLEPDGISRTNARLLHEELNKVIIEIIGEEYYKLYTDRMTLLTQLNFLKKSGIIRFLLKHKGNYYINRLLKIT